MTFGYTSCRNATIRDIPDVVLIHVSAFPGFFLTRLGKNFLHVMYHAFLFHRSSIFVVCQNSSGQLVGFAVGALQRGSNDKLIGLRYAPQFLFAVLPTVFSSPRFVITRLARRFFNSKSTFKIPDDSALLRSIAVAPTAQSSGSASSLLLFFENLAWGKGAKSVCLTTDRDNNDRAQRFYSRHGYVVIARFLQDGSRWMFMMSKNLKDMIHE